MKRKQVKAILNKLGVDNRFSLRAVTFLGRDKYQVLTIKDWKRGQPRQAIRDVFGKWKVVVEFDY